MAKKSTSRRKRGGRKSAPRRRKTTPAKPLGRRAKVKRRNANILAREKRKATAGARAERRGITKEGQRKRIAKEYEETIRTLQRRFGVGRKKAQAYYRTGARRARGAANVSPRERAKFKFAQRYAFVRDKKTKKLDPSRVRDRTTGRYVSVATIERRKAAYRREARLHEIAELRGKGYAEARRYVRDVHDGDTRRALVRVAYDRIKTEERGALT